MPQMQRHAICVLHIYPTQVEIWKKVDEKKLREDLKRVYDKGIRSLAVVLMHSYTYAYGVFFIKKLNS